MSSFGAVVQLSQNTNLLVVWGKNNPILKKNPQTSDILLNIAVFILQVTTVNLPSSLPMCLFCRWQNPSAA